MSPVPVVPAAAAAAEAESPWRSTPWAIVDSGVPDNPLVVLNAAALFGIRKDLTIAKAKLETNALDVQRYQVANRNANKRYHRLEARYQKSNQRVSELEAALASLQEELLASRVRPPCPPATSAPEATKNDDAVSAAVEVLGAALDKASRKAKNAIACKIFKCLDAKAPSAIDKIKHSARKQASTESPTSVACYCYCY